jgi:hypothetical protein
MSKKLIFVSAICLGLIFSMQQNCFAQAKTNDELKAEREALKTEMKSQAVLDRLAKMEKLEAPKTSGIKSVDDLAGSSSAMLVSAKENNKLIPEMYKRTIGETIDGVTDVTVKKPTLQELEALATNLGTQILAVSNATSAVKSATDDVSKASPMQAPKGTKSLNYSKDVLGLLAPELQLNLKMVNNLIATMKSAKNL